MAPPAMRIEKPDATFKSLSALLASPATSARSHLSLIGNSNLSGSITHYLATLPTDEASKFARQLVTSEVIWSESEEGNDAIPFTDPSSTSGSQSQSKQDSSSNLLSRAQLLFEATARAVLGRIQVIVHKHKGDLGWNAQRSLVSWIRALNDAVHVDQESIPKNCLPLPISSFALQTGLVAGLQAARAQRKQQEASKTSLNGIISSNALSTRYALRRAEEEWCTTLTECLQVITSHNSEENESTTPKEEEDVWEMEFRKVSIDVGIEKPKRHNSRNDPQTVLLYLTTQVSPYVSVKRLSILPPLGMIDFLSKTMLDLFDHCDIFQSIKEDVQQDADQMLILQPSSGTTLRSQMLNDHPLFPLFGPLSRLLSLAFSNVIRTSSPVQVQEILLGLSPNVNSTPLVRMHDIANLWQAKWLGCRLAGAKEEEIAPSSRPQTKILWNIFKTLLFSYTMIFDALMESIVDVCPTPTDTRPVKMNTDGIESNQQQRWMAMTESNIPIPYLQIVHTILLTYSKLSWIIATFGTGGFDVYRRVFYEALEVLSRDGRSSVALTIELIPSSSTSLQVNSARRAEATFFLDVVEQLMVQLPEDLIIDVILPACRPYLDDRTYQEAFEAAHSVILSIYSTGKECLLEFTPYYSKLLLSSFPINLSVEQLTLAFSTVIDAVSDRSDTLAWHTLELLWHAIEKEKVLQSFNQKSKNSIDSQGGHDAATLTRKSTIEKVVKPKEDDEIEKVEKDIESELSDVYVAQIANVNLVLLRSTLDRVKRLIMQRTRGSEERLHLCQKTFAGLSGLDASTREEGVRWWLAERERFGI